MVKRPAVIFLQTFLWFYVNIEVHRCWLFYSPASETQTIQDCIHLKANNSPFYPHYCDKLLELHKNEIDQEGETTVNERDTTDTSITEIGWGWSDWSEWISRACPDVCGRKCKKRFRACQGPYEVACKDGKGEELSTCAALNVTSTTTKPTTGNDNVEGEGTDDEYSMNMDEYEEDDTGDKDDNKDDEEDDDDKENAESENEDDEEEDKNQNLSNMKDRRVRKRRLRKLRKDMKLF